MIDDYWYKNATIYSLDLETFMDGTGDGIGDFRGLTARLDYLQGLGVDVIWLAPFMPTPNRDNGYDISDYYGVDPRHGSPGDFAEFMNLANDRGMKVIIDLVINHTSDEHPWFREARKGPDNPYHDWYVWSDEKPADAEDGIIFPGVQEATWTYDRKARKYYFHRFYKFQPDLNVDNPKVREEIHRIIRYYLTLGVAGFRVDAVPFVLESQGPGEVNKPEIRFGILEDLRRFLQWQRGDAILLGEANVAPKDAKKYFGGGGAGLHMMFNFYANQFLFYALASEDAAPLAEALEATRTDLPMAQWGNFLRNHDELDLGRLSDAQRKVVFDHFGPEKDMQLYDRGIRRRLAPMLGERPRLELAYSLMFGLPGSPVMRYGDELGMGDDLRLEERNAVRTPMQWSDSPNGGFSRAAEKDLVHPVIKDGPYAFPLLNVENQMRKDDSLLNWTKKMVRLRKETPEIGYGDWEIIDTRKSSVLGLRYTFRGKVVVVLHNFSDHPVVVELKKGPEAATHLLDLREVIELEPADDGGGHSVRLGSYGYRWFRLREV